MTVPVETPTISYSYTGPGDYAFPFRIFDEGDIQLTYTDIQGVSVPLHLNTDYTVTISAGVDGGICTLIYPATVGHINIRRELPVTQTTDYVNNNPFDMEILETDLDRIIMILQELGVIVDFGAAYSSWRGDWLPLTDYDAKDMVSGPNTNIYASIVTHTSSADFQADIAAGRWRLVIDVSAVEAARLDAEQSAAEALASEEAARASENAAASSEQQALISEANAASDSQDAANCAAAAHTDAANLGDAVVEAYHWANYPENSAVPESASPPEYSAYHWMKKAQTIAGGGVTGITGLAPIGVDNTDPHNPVISVAGVPAGGTTGQVQVKSSNSDYDTEWSDSSGGGLAWETSDSGLIIGIDGAGYLLDCSAGPRIIDLPHGIIGEQIGVGDWKGDAGTNNITIKQDPANKIMGLAENLILDIDNSCIVLTYANSTEGWKIIQTTPSGNVLPNILHGNGEPSDSLGQDGDIYFRLS